MRCLNCFFLSVFITGALSCTSGNKKGQSESAAPESKTTSEIPATPAKAVTADPDTTDNIPGDQYGINSSNENTASLVRLTLKDLFKEDLGKDLIQPESRKFIFFEYDLNGDSKKEIFVGLIGPYFCGSGGCTVLLLDNEGNKINQFTVVDYPIVIDNQKTNGWDNLFMMSGGKYHVMKFNGKEYPSNPSVEPVLDVIPGDGLPRALNFVNEPYPWFTF
ncbi:MAG: hypothetical protein RR346_10510 [Bacteroidales bacterium]